MADARRILYGRRRGRKLRDGQQALLDDVVPGLEIALGPSSRPIEPAALFGRPVREVWLEVGFGAGEHLLAQAAANRDVGLIGCEPYVTGVVRMVRGLREAGLDNIRIWRDDARLLIDRLADGSLARVFVLFPDPWPKSRHHKRRFVSAPVLERLAAVMRDDAELRVATDDRGYLVWILAHLWRSERFAWTARAPSDWRRRTSDWPATRYERKACEQGRSCFYLRYRRRPRASRPP
ncbi:MAG: tRNA (guanine(46)-N(7))-methyltransferase TrmB [Defluviicoccus sp.]|nr:tRNA (guanine(46)-N(7))-methyltransferase TrmB [Defluviicoccus sp.]